MAGEDSHRRDDRGTPTPMIRAGFQHRVDAERFLWESEERLEKLGLELHPDKTRLIEFGRFAERTTKSAGAGEMEACAKRRSQKSGLTVDRIARLFHRWPATAAKFESLCWSAAEASPKIEVPWRSCAPPVIRRKKMFRIRFTSQRVSVIREMAVGLVGLT
jgi:hypothetical protein